MKKISGRFFKLIANLMPKALKALLKKNDRLFEFYSNALKRSGFFYGFPSSKQYNAAYQKIFNKQQKFINALPDSKQILFDLVLLVPIGKLNSIEKTIRSIPKNINVHVVSRKEDIEKVMQLIEGKFSNKIEFYGAPVAAVNTENSILIMYAGQILHEDTSKVLYHFVQDYDIAYTDTDRLSNNKHHTPALLPDWNPDLQLSTAYIRTGIWFKNQSKLPCIISNHAQVIAEMAASLYLNLNSKPINICHLPYSLIHETETRKFNYANYANTLSNWVLNKAEVEVNTNVGMLTWKWKHSQPLVSIIIPTKNARELVKQCVESIFHSAYDNYEIILVDNNSDDLESLEYFESLNAHPKIRLLEYKKEFNYSAINNFAVEQANGEVIALINNDIKATDNFWLDNMVSHVMREDIGCVGAKLLYEDGRIQHAGVVLGYGGGAGHAFKYFPRYHPGYIKRLLVSQNYSAVTAACLLVKKADYEAVKGLNEKDLSIAFNDVDFCLRILQLGKRNLYCAEAELYHYESASRGLDIEPKKRRRFNNELKYLQQKWGKYIKHDPAYNPNLTLKRENFSPKIREEFSEH